MTQSEFDELNRLRQENAEMRQIFSDWFIPEDGNEGTDSPVWFILSPRQMFRKDSYQLASMFSGPYPSREAAQDYLDAHRYRYGNGSAVVFCHSAYQCPDYRDFLKAAKKFGSPMELAATVKA